MEMNETDEENKNFFAGFQQWDWIKVVYIIFHTLLTFIVPSLLYSICWYERYGPHLHYRLVTNILLSHTCWIGIFRSFFVRIPSVIVILGGPFSLTTCDVYSTFTRFSFLLFFNELAIWQFVRFLYIAKEAKLTLAEDNLIALYLTLSNIFLTATFIFAVEMLSFRVSEMDYHLCTGINPYQTIMKLHKMPWFDRSMEPIPMLSNLIYSDPVVKLFGAEFVLILFFAFISYCITNKDLVRILFSMYS
jgi:hypothetical protein